MFCTNCGAQVVPGQKFCNQCGCPVSVNDINVAPTPMPAPAKKKNVLSIVLAIVGVLLVVSIAGAFAARALVNKVRDTITVRLTSATTRLVVSGSNPLSTHSTEA